MTSDRLLEEVLKHATIANHDGELSSMVVLMVTKGNVPEMHLALSPNDVHQMNTAVDLLKMEVLRIIVANTEIGGKRE
jgi:hypothetical protein